MPDGGGLLHDEAKQVAIKLAPDQLEPGSIGSTAGTRLMRRYQKFVDPEQTMFFIEASSPSLMKRIVEVLLMQVNEINIEINEDGMTVRGMESSQIALMDVNLNKRNFCTWKLNRPATVGIQLSIMRDMLKAGGGDDFWRLYQFPDDEEIHMEMYSKKYNTSKLHFSWKSMDIEMESMTPPDDFTAHEPAIVMNSKRFKELMNDFKNLGTEVEITMN
eukprot:g16007.t1